nr:hypothetical protein [Tanacetum cinerariifolium]
MKFFLVQKVAESRRIKKKSMIVCWPPRMLRGEEGKLLALNEVIADALDEIKTQENNVEILDVVYVIKFQKRDLPHTHRFEEHLKYETPSEIDDIIYAELPSSTDDSASYKVVTEYMLHGPCGKDARYAACTTDGKCSKYFPKPFLAETFLDEEGYPHYHRRDNKRHVAGETPRMSLGKDVNVVVCSSQQAGPLIVGKKIKDSQGLHKQIRTVELLQGFHTNTQHEGEYYANGEIDTSKQEFNC